MPETSPLLDKLKEQVLAIGPSAFLFVISTFLWPLSRFVLVRIKSRSFQIWFHIIFGLILAYILFLNDIIIPIVFCISSYFIIDKFKPVVIFLLAFVFNSAINVYQLRKSASGWEFEVTCIVMIMMQRVIATSFNIYHGRQISQGEKKKREFFNKLAILEKPPFLEWVAYCFTPMGSNSGPHLEFKIFSYMLDCGNRPPIKKDSISRKRAISRYISGFCWAGFNLVFMNKFGPDFYEQPFYTQAPVYIRHFLMIFCTIGQACRYFPAWHPVEAAIYELGAGECEYITDFNDISNCSIFDVLTSRTVGEWLQRWNHTSHIFWKRYLLYPLLDAKYPYQIAHHSIFVFSALWHGFSPVYFLVLPEMIASTVADSLLTLYFPIKSRSLSMKFFCHYFTIMSMMNSTSTWWYRSFDLFFSVRKSHQYSGTVITFFVTLLLELLNFYKKLTTPKVAKVTEKAKAK